MDKKIIRSNNYHLCKKITNILVHQNKIKFKKSMGKIHQLIENCLKILKKKITLLIIIKLKIKK